MSTPAQSAPAASALQLTSEQRTVILKALADPRRFELLEQIARADCPMSCTAVRASLTISPATISHHVKELETAGIIRIEREGKFHYLRLQPGILEAVADLLHSLGRGSCPAPASDSEK